MGALALLIPLLTSVGRALVDRYITSDAAREISTMAFQAADNLATAEGNLQAIADNFEAKVTAAKENGQVWAPDQSEIDAIWATIRANDDAWANLKK